LCCGQDWDTGDFDWDFGCEGGKVDVIGEHCVDGFGGMEVTLFWWGLGDCGGRRGFRRS
jgi:hypothetical protein